MYFDPNIWSKIFTYCTTSLSYLNLLLTCKDLYHIGMKSNKKRKEQYILNFMFERFCLGDFERCYSDIKQEDVNLDFISGMSFKDKLEIIIGDDGYHDYVYIYLVKELDLEEDHINSLYLYLQKLSITNGKLVSKYSRKIGKTTMVPVFDNNPKVWENIYWGINKKLSKFIDEEKIKQVTELNVANIKKIINANKELLWDFCYYHLKEINRNIIQQKNDSYLNYLIQMSWDICQDKVHLFDKENMGYKLNDDLGFHCSGFIFNFNGKLIMFNER